MITELAFILDRSGSMEMRKQAAIVGFNEFLRDQQEVPGQTRLTLVLFDQEVLTVHDSVAVAEVLPLDDEGYVPRGTTALLDAIGETIDRLVARAAAADPAERPGHVVVAILTDGLENSSVRFGWRRIAERIAHQSENHGWDFMFLSAGPDAIATAARMRIAANHCAAYASDATGHVSASKGVSRKISALRAMRSGRAGDAERHDFAAPLDAIVREEDQDRRG
jgi:Mg-chelatase subunit ChlD